jgi:hypothetical protein
MPYHPLPLLVAISLQIALILSTALIKTTTYFQPESLIYPACCLILTASVWFIGSWVWITRKLFHPYTIFLISAVLFNAGQAILEVFHGNRFGLLRGHFSEVTLSNTLFFVLLGLSTFHLGALLSLAACNGMATLSRLRQPLAMRGQEQFLSTHRALFPRQTRSQPAAAPSTDLARPNDTAPGTVLIGWGLTSIAILPSIYVFLKSIQIVLTRGYQGLYQGDQETSVGAAPDIIAGFIVPASMFLLTGSTAKDSPAYSLRKRNLALGLIALYIISKLLLGERRKVGTALAAVLWLWHDWVARLPAVLVLGCGLGLAVLFPMVAATRNLAGQRGISLDAIQSQLYGEHNPLVGTLSEMWGTMMTVASTIDLVPSSRPFQMGADYGYALLTLFPNLFWKVHPTIERGLAGNWLTWAIDPEFAHRGGGYGYSFIAEAYLNFGWVGGPAMLGLIGFLYTSLTLWAVNSRSAARMALMATFTFYFPFYARSEAALYVRALVWYAFMPYWGALGLSQWLHRQKARLLRRHNARSRSLG